MPDALTEKVIGAALEVHHILGPGLLESIYEEALCEELFLRKINYEKQKEVDILYKGKIIKTQRIDMIIENELIVELKAVTIVPEIVMAQTLSYLKATGLKRAIIINFYETSLVKGIRRISL